MRAMSDLVARRNQLLVMQTMEKNRLQILPKELEMTIKPILTAFKNQIEKLESNNPAFLSLPDLCFFEPEISLQLTESGFFSKNQLPDSWFELIDTFEIPEQGNLKCDLKPQIMLKKCCFHLLAQKPYRLQNHCHNQMRVAIVSK